MNNEYSHLASQTVGGFLESLSDKTPTPGGGAAAAMTGATACATAGMVLSYSIDKKSLAEHQGFNQDAKYRIDELRTLFLKLAEDDAKGYGVLNALWKLNKDHPDRVAGWDAAVAGAIEPPRLMLRAAVDLIELCTELVATTNTQLKSDLGVAAVLGQAAARSAAWNMKINIPLLPSETHAQWHAAIDEHLAMADKFCQSVESGCA